MVDRSRRLLIAVSAAVAMAGASVAAALHAQASVPPTTAPGWTLNFSDDFNGSAGSGVDGNWRYTTGTSYPGGPANFGTGEVETMTSSTQNVSLDGSGNLGITPVNNGGWTSGRIETNRQDFQPPAGGKLWVQARIQMPNVTGAAAAGYWPAFWMLGTPYRGNWWNWPGIGEIDIMENVNGLNREYGTLHCGVSPGGPCNETTGLANNVPCNGSTCQAAFHTYAIQWDQSTNPQTIRWYLDGVNFHTVSSNQVDPGTWAAATNHGYFIILNVAMGGAFPAALGGGPTAATASGVPMRVDYVAVWSGSASAVGPPTGPGGPGPSPSPTPPTCGPLISQGRPTTSSAIEAPNLAAQFAVDGDLGTRWSSAFSDPQWMQVDLGSVQPITRVKLSWEAAYATAYQLQVSNNAGGPWTVAYDNTAGTGGVEDLKVSATARYVRLWGTQRATPYGYSLWEFQVFGGCGGTPTPTGGPTPTPTPTGGPTNPPPGGRDAYGTIQAESANQLQGLPNAGSFVGPGGNGDFLRFDGVNFGGTPATQFKAQAASGAAGGVSGLVEVRLDSPGAAPLGSFAIANTGGWQSWHLVPANISAVTGTHTVYITLTSGQPADYVNLDWISFGH